MGMRMTQAEGVLLGEMELAMERLETRLRMLESQLPRVTEVFSEVGEWLEDGWAIVDDWKDG